MDEVKVIFEVYQIKPSYTKYEKTFYPVSVKGIKGPSGAYIFNCLKEIPKDTKYLMGTLYNYKGHFYIKDINPYNPKSV